jgi:hypothetical protein
LESTQPRRFLGCGIADGKEVLECAFFVATTARPLDVREASRPPSKYLSTIVPLAVHNGPEFRRIAKGGGMATG